MRSPDTQAASGSTGTSKSDGILIGAQPKADHQGRGIGEQARKPRQIIPPPPPRSLPWEINIKPTGKAAVSATGKAAEGKRVDKEEKEQERKVEAKPIEKAIKAPQSAA